MDLPSSWQFLGPMWWVLHVAAIGLVFYIGYMIGKSSGGGSEADEPQEPWHKREERERAEREGTKDGRSDAPPRS